MIEDPPPPPKSGVYRSPSTWGAWRDAEVITPETRPHADPDCMCDGCVAFDCHEWGLT